MSEPLAVHQQEHHTCNGDACGVKVALDNIASAQGKMSNCLTEMRTQLTIFIGKDGNNGKFSEVVADVERLKSLSDQQQGRAQVSGKWEQRFWSLFATVLTSGAAGVIGYMVHK